MKKFKETQRGITLIALVITIVILIILATVTLNVVLGDGGLIQRAQQAKELTEEAAEKEEQQILNLTGYFDELAADSVVEAFKAGDIKVGDYVNYTPDSNSPVNLTEADTGYGTTQTYSVDSSTTWRVLGLSEDGQHLLLTSGSPIKSNNAEYPYLILQGATGYLNCVQTLNKAASVYNNSTLAEETRSMTIEDIENVLGDMTVEYPQEGEHGTGKVYFTDDEDKTPIGGTTSYPSYTYTAEDYTPEGAATLTHATAGEKVTADAWMFMYTTDGETRADYVPERVYDMLFAGTTESSNYSKSYWLASPGVGADSGVASFGPGAVNRGGASSGGGYLFVSGGGWVAVGCAVRPVVVLKSSVTVDQLEVVADKTEATWTTEGGQQYGSGNIEDVN